MKVVRLTITLDPQILKKLRNLQSKRIKFTKKNCSFSKIIGITLRSELSKEKKYRLSTVLKYIEKTYETVLEDSEILKIKKGLASYE